LRVIWKGKEGCYRLVEKVISQVQFEIGQIDLLLDSYSDLLERLEKNVPDLVESTAIASVLHSFYNGLENIFLSIAKGIDRDVPASAQWHRDLLNRMTEATAERKPVLTAETSEQLSEYLGFRHFFRHSYSFFMEWDELEKLVTPLKKVWARTKDELESFLHNLSFDRTTDLAN
jgi:hypothetical protein